MPIKGEIFKSPFAGFRLQTRSEAIHIHPGTGVETHRTPALTAEFGIFGPEIDQPLADGTSHKSAVIMGGYFDSAEAAERLGWTEDEHDSVVADLKRWCNKWPEAVQLFSKPAASLPWPTYDAVDAAQIPVLAETLGLLAETIAYESENKNRKTVLAKLNESIEKQAAAEPVNEESLTVA